LTVLHWRLPQSEDVLFEEALADKFFQVPPEALAVDDMVSFTVMIRIVLFCSGECGVVLGRPRTPHPWLIFDGIEDFIDGELQRSEMLFHLEVLGRIQSGPGTLIVCRLVAHGSDHRTATLTSLRLYRL